MAGDCQFQPANNSQSFSHVSDIAKLHWWSHWFSGKKIGETEINYCVPLSSAVLKADINGVLCGHTTEKIQPWTYWWEGEPWKNSVWNEGLPCVPACHFSPELPSQCIYHTWFLLELKPGYITHLQVEITKIKSKKNIKEISHSSFERLKPERNSVHSSALAVVSARREPALWLASGQHSHGTFAGAGVREQEIWFPCPPFCQSFCGTCGTCHLTSQCLVSFHLESGEQ